MATPRPLVITNLAAPALHRLVVGTLTCNWASTVLGRMNGNRDGAARLETVLPVRPIGASP
jgi:hypothetical protein